MKPTFKILLFIAILIGAVVRVWKITTLPFPPNGDELAFGYYGWSLLHFATDEYGKFLPFYFSSIGDYKYPVLAYLNILPAIFFGLSEITVRFWSAVSGILLIPLSFILSRLIFKSNVIALVTSYFIALSPWSISLSRYGYENNVAVTITTAAIICLLKANESKFKRNYLIISFILLLISSFTYGTQKVFIPLFLLLLSIYAFFKISPFYNLRRVVLGFFIALTLINALSLIPWQSRGRASGVLSNGLTSQEVNRLEEVKIEAGISSIHIPVKATQAFHNKVRISGSAFLERYSNHFSPSFLFFHGESGIERIPQTGQMLLIDLLFLPLGLILLLINPILRKGAVVILLWLIAAPVASALTLGDPHINRASIMIPPLVLISSFGFSQILFFIKNKILRIFIFPLLFFAIIYSSLFVLNQLFVHKSVHQPWIREQVNKLMVEEVYKLKDQYKSVVISKTDNEYVFFLFYKQIKPQEFIENSDISEESKVNQWKRVDRMYNIYFKMPFDCPKGGKLDILYVCTGPNIPQNSKVLKVIRYLDKVPAYSFVQFYPLSQLPSELPKLPEGLEYMVDVEKSPSAIDGLIPDSSENLW